MSQRTEAEVLLLWGHLQENGATLNGIIEECLISRLFIVKISIEGISMTWRKTWKLAVVKPLLTLVLNGQEETCN